MVRLNRLALSLLALLIVGCSKQAMTPQSAPIAPVSSLPPPAAEMRSLPEQLQFRHEELSDVPDAVQDWVDKLGTVQIGASLSHGDRTYLFVEPAPGASVGDRIHVAGFAAGLIEGTLNVRLVDPSGKVVAETHGQGAGGMGTSWGSFIVDLDASEAPSGSYWLELGDYSMRDGSWQLKERMKVIKE